MHCPHLRTADAASMLNNGTKPNILARQATLNISCLDSNYFCIKTYGIAELLMKTLPLGVGIIFTTLCQTICKQWPNKRHSPSDNQYITTVWLNEQSDSDYAFPPGRNYRTVFNFKGPNAFNVHLSSKAYFVNKRHTVVCEGLRLLKKLPVVCGIEINERRPNQKCLSAMVD